MYVGLFLRQIILSFSFRNLTMRFLFVGLIFALASCQSYIVDIAVDPNSPGVFIAENRVGSIDASATDPSGYVVHCIRDGDAFKCKDAYLAPRTVK